MRCASDTIVRIAEAQHGQIHLAQLLGAGLDRSTVQRWRAQGRLRPRHREVFALGHAAPSLLGDLMAAVLACGPGAVISHASAAHLLGLVRARPARPEVTVPTTAARRRPGIIIHRVRRLEVLDIAAHHAIGVTTVPRTLLDLAPRWETAQLARAHHEAWVRHRTEQRYVHACLARNPGKPGGAKLRRALGADVTLSELEAGFVALLAEHGLPLPRTNVDYAGDKVDCHWPDRGLTIELLSFRYHATRSGFESDVARRRRSGHLAYTWGDVFERPAATIAELGDLLGLRPRRPDAGR